MARTRERVMSSSGAPPKAKRAANAQPYVRRRCQKGSNDDDDDDDDDVDKEPAAPKARSPAAQAAAARTAATIRTAAVKRPGPRRSTGAQKSRRRSSQAAKPPASRSRRSHPAEAFLSRILSLDDKNPIFLICSGRNLQELMSTEINSTIIYRNSRRRKLFQIISRNCTSHYYYYYTFHTFKFNKYVFDVDERHFCSLYKKS